MPHFQRGDLWTAFAPTNLFLITTNSTIRKDGALIMGRGIAQQARDRFPGLDVVLGKQILSLCGQKGSMDCWCVRAGRRQSWVLFKSRGITVNLPA